MGNRINYLPDTPTPNVPTTTVSGAKPVPDSALSGSYRDTAVDTTHTYDPGILVLPVASLTPKTAVVRVHGGYGMRTQNMAGIKKDTPPILPTARDIRDPITGRVSDTLVGATVSILQPTPNPTGLGYDWTVSGQYTFVTTRPAADGGPRVPGLSVLPAARLPFPITPQDPAATSIIGGGSSGGDFDTVYSALAPVGTFGANIQAGNFAWPFTVLPPAFFDPVMLVG